MKKLSLFLFVMLWGICCPTVPAGAADPASAEIRQSPDKARKGRQIPVFTLPSRDGGEGSFGGAVGRSKYTLVANVASGCGYSLLSMEVLGKMLKKYGDKLDVVTVWTDLTREIWLDYGSEYKRFIDWMDLWDDKGLFDTYVDSKISPTFVLLSPDDKVVAIVKGVRVKKIGKILNKL